LLFHYKDARVHCAVLKKRAGPGPDSRWRGRRLVRGRVLLSQPTLQGPTACFGSCSLASRFHSAGRSRAVVLTSQVTQLNGQCST